ncbi:LuxR C-terminal-related transcriptional regulator [uncultured Dokdonia sp.]|uniref:LuxR C-terminal-related transcriptional regulator n=1 Tax=uncultured Dokdonia sp. TaxID=575653 RepID=UPI00262E0F2E|nr:LuxR C-terminal-related transcriptional regulator [uncultured Dokdonia sp.]
MFTKIIIAEDHDTNHFGIEDALKMYNPIIEKVKYCDDALLKIRVSADKGYPYDLLITDLNFEEDHRERTIVKGEGLILEAKELLPNLKVIVYSVEKRIARIQKLYENYHIDAFVEKGRDASLHIRKAIETIIQGHSYCTPKTSQLLRSTDEINELEEKDILLLELLSKGVKQKYIAQQLNCSISSVEKQLNKLKVLFNASNPVHLISIAKDWGVI